MTETTEPKMLRITLLKSAIGYSERHKATVRALGLAQAAPDRGAARYPFAARDADEGEPSREN